jgi:Ca2+-binding RTX toxin-like protein
VLGGVEVRLATRLAQNTGAGGSDTLINIENVQGSRFADKLYGSIGNNLIDGGDGNDLIQGGAGDDHLLGGNGDDVIDGGAGNDIMDGGFGIDTLDYQSLTTGVTVSLAITGPQNTGSAGFDQITGFENLRGSKGNDILTGDDNANRIQGQTGNDIINGGGGDDQLFGDGGDDVLDGGLGVDILGGGAGIDRFIIGSLDGDTIRDFTLGETIDVSALPGWITRSPAGPATGRSASISTRTAPSTTGTSRFKGPVSRQPPWTSDPHRSRASIPNLSKGCSAFLPDRITS